MSLQFSYTFPDCLYDVNALSAAFRLILALIFGGIIGLDRGTNKHPAGFRTHILVCVGACLAMMTNQYMYQEISSSTDIARLGAQVITGVGFLGAGTILVTGRQRIKGLTTAAGLWASACLGLALGIGFYSGAIVAAILIFVSLALLPQVEQRLYAHSRVIDMYIEVESFDRFKPFCDAIKALDIEVLETHPAKSDAIMPGGVAFYISVRLPKNGDHEPILEALADIDGVYLVDEI